MPNNKGTRKSNGEGNIRKRDGRYEGSLVVGKDAKGKPIRKYFTGKKRQDVVDKMNDTKTLLGKGIQFDYSKITVGEWLDEWIKKYKASKLRPSTMASYEVQIRVHIKPTLGHIKLTQLQPTHIQTLINEKQQDGKREDGQKGILSPRSIKYIHTVLSGALEKAMKCQMIPYNPANMVELPEQKKTKEIKTLDAEQVKRFLSEAKDTRLYIAYLLALSSGARRGEILAVHWQDIDMKAGTLTINQNLVRIPKVGLVFQAPKTSESRRTIKLRTGVMKELAAYKSRQNEERLSAGPAYKDNGLMFCDEEGKPIDPRYFEKAFKKVLVNAGLEKMGLHSLRHTYASLQLENGVNIKTIQGVLGHTNPAFTMRIYSHVTQKMQEEASDKTAEWLPL